MKNAIIYIHGMGGNAAEALHYEPLFPDRDVLGFDYKSETPWDAKTEFSAYYDSLGKRYATVSIIANSIGAFFAMNALGDKNIERAFFISPIVDMEKLISDMMARSNVNEKELLEKKEIKTPSGEILSWKYYDYVRSRPVNWRVPTHILYGEKDALTSFETVSSFAARSGASLEIMKDGEHWFHTEEQMAFLDEWLLRAFAEK